MPMRVVTKIEVQRCERLRVCVYSILMCVLKVSLSVCIVSLFSIIASANKAASLQSSQECSLQINI